MTPHIQFDSTMRLISVIFALGFLQACAVGIIKVEGPEVPPVKNPVSLDRDVYFEVCTPSKLKNTGWNEEMNRRIESILRRNFAIQAHAGAPAIGKPYLHFLFTRETDFLYTPSLFISFLTLSAIPGYSVERTKIDMPFAARDANGEMIHGTFNYEYRNRLFLWLPLILYPDMVIGVNGGYVNKDKEHLGLELALNRFILDISEQIRQQAKDAKIGNGSQVLKCPAQ